MIDFMIGLGLFVLGVGIFQFSAMFGLYKAQKTEGAPPWPYWVMRTLSYLLMGIGVVLMISTWVS